MIIFAFLATKCQIFVIFSDIPVSELPLELLLLQVVLPALLEEAHTRQWIKNIVRLWLVTIAYLLYVNVQLRVLLLKLVVNSWTCGCIW